MREGQSAEGRIGAISAIKAMLLEENVVVPALERFLLIQVEEVGLREEAVVLKSEFVSWFILQKALPSFLASSSGIPSLVSFSLIISSFCCTIRLDASECERKT